ncbi:alpha/beta hydrolase, partial [Thermodesulfobacteriota bacterium]
MKKAILHFAHANGLPGGTYTKLVSYLQQHYSVIAVDKLGHTPEYPVTDNWPALLDELIEHIECRADEPVIGVGHSLGGILTFLAAYHRPELFSQIIILEPALLYGPFALLFFFLKKVRLIDRVYFVTQTQKRRAEWPDRKEAETYLGKRPPFKQFDPECLRDYVKYGTVKNETGVKLSFDVEVETDLFKTTPH